MTMVHLSDVVVMEVPNTVLKHKHTTRNTLARNRMLARLTEATEQGALLATHDNAELMWLRRHVGTDDIAEPEPYLFCFQHDWGVLRRRSERCVPSKGLQSFIPIGRFGAMTRRFCGVWRCRMICLGRVFLLRRVVR